MDATREPWSRHYNTYSHVTGELPAVVEENFPARADARGVFGHSYYFISTSMEDHVRHHAAALAV